jgi:DNA-binding NtrC family response regulator
VLYKCDLQPQANKAVSSGAIMIMEGNIEDDDICFRSKQIKRDLIREFLSKSIDELNREYAEKVVDMLGGNKSKAAELLGISRTSLWRILKEDERS